MPQAPLQIKLKTTLFILYRVYALFQEGSQVKNIKSYEKYYSIEQLVLPPASDSSPDPFDVFQNYEIEAEGRDELKEYLAEQGIGTLIQWGGKAVHQLCV